MLSTFLSSSNRIIQLLLVAVGAVMIAYAISDHPLYGGEPGFGTLQGLMAATGIAVALCGLLPNRIAGRILLVIVTSLVMLVFAEFAGEVILGARHRPIFQADDQLIFKFIPNRWSVMTNARVNGGETVAHRINSQGFRGEELLPIGKATRIVVYGDSFVHAFYTSDKETFVEQLGATLASRLGRHIEAINAGVSSYGPDQIALKLEGELDRLRPDLVIVAVFAGNDYGDLLRNKIFRLDADGTLAENRWELDPKVRNWLELSQRESILKRAIRSALGRELSPDDSTADVINMDFLIAESEREYRKFILEHDNVVTNTHVDYYSADVSLMPESASARYKIELMGAVLKRIRDVAKKNEVPLAFLFIPHPMDVTEGHDVWNPVNRKRFPAYDGRNQIAPLEAMARSLGVPFLSLYNLYRSHGASELYFRGGDDHWNAAGQKLAAKAMADLLIRNGLPRLKGSAVTSSERADLPLRPPRGQ